MDDLKIQKLLILLEETRIMLKRAELACDQAEKELRVRLNERFEVIP